MSTQPDLSARYVTSPHVPAQPSRRDRLSAYATRVATEHSCLHFAGKYASQSGIRDLETDSWLNDRQTRVRCLHSLSILVRRSSTRLATGSQKESFAQLSICVMHASARTRAALFYAFTRVTRRVPPRRRKLLENEQDNGREPVTRLGIFCKQ